MKTISTLLLLSSFLVFVIPPPANPGSSPEADLNIYLPMIIKSASPSSNLIVNGNFEAGRTGWIEYEDSPFFDFPIIVQEKDLPPPIKPHDGVWAAWLGGDDQYITYIEQTISIPSSAPELSYWYWIDSIFDCDASHGGVSINGTLVENYLLCAATDTGGWMKRKVNLSAYAGQTVKLRFISETALDNYSSFYIDSVYIQKSP